MRIHPIENVVPHRGSALLLDQVLRWDEDSIEVALVVPASGLFNQAGGVPAWIGIEYMAQAIAAWAGCRARRDGRPPQIGFEAFAVEIAWLENCSNWVPSPPVIWQIL